MNYFLFDSTSWEKTKIILNFNFFVYFSAITNHITKEKNLTRINNEALKYFLKIFVTYYIRIDNYKKLKSQASNKSKPEQNVLSYIVGLTQNLFILLNIEKSYCKYVSLITMVYMCFIKTG